jgi:small subunit ribosomal protein S11
MAVKKRTKRKFSECAVHIQATFNNTVVSGTTMSGDLLAQSSAGKMGFKGSRRGTPYAAQMAAEAVAKGLLDEFDTKRVVVYVSGPGAGRDSAIRSLYNSGLEIISLTDRTGIPHNGCRPRKRRRV